MALGVFIRCEQCGRNNYLDISKVDLPTEFQVTCQYCGQTENYRRFEAVEERWEFDCLVCGGRFFIKRSPSINVRCPHCSSVLRISSDGVIAILERRQPPLVRPASGAGAVIGGAVGALVAGPIGALLGLMAGGALGATSVPEAREV